MAHACGIGLLNKRFNDGFTCFPVEEINFGMLIIGNGFRYGQAQVMCLLEHYDPVAGFLIIFITQDFVLQAMGKLYQLASPVV